MNLNIFQLIHIKKILLLNNEFKSNILEPTDIGSIILYRIDGMPQLIQDF